MHAKCSFSVMAETFYSSIQHARPPKIMKTDIMMYRIKPNVISTCSPYASQNPGRNSCLNSYKPAFFPPSCTHLANSSPTLTLKFLPTPSNHNSYPSTQHTNHTHLVNNQVTHTSLAHKSHAPHRRAVPTHSSKHIPRDLLMHE